MPANGADPSRSRPRRRWWRWALANLVVVLVILEIGLRLGFGAVFPPRFFEPHPDFGHFHVPGRTGHQHTREYDSYVAINAKGLRDQDYAYAKPAGTFRILILGDSFVEGLQVEHAETFEAQLETALSARSGGPVEVINGGVSRYGTDNALLFLEGEGLKYRPDLVIYALYPNDVTDNITNDLFRLENGVLAQEPINVPVTDHIRAALYDYSYLYRVVLAISIRVMQQTDDTLIETGWGRVLPIYRASLRPREESAWQLTAALLARMQADVTQNGAALLIVYLPEIFQSEDRLWAEVEQSGEALDRDAPQTQLAQIIPPGAQFLDLTPGFQAAAQTEALYYDVDGHFNPAGHTLAARLIQAALADRALVPGP